ncbi:conserved unknown protein [Ectocarpus siliculosus]|uniref:DUF4139 domain-containing protein n=1 Tax=Ectocarpus siliculosus TaxID=2880 RepID=D8LRM9_ECTSI|nr:conserved unknown protein [Ectocarpus siliculosus]|eukprot:CBN77790.1 conserved unknown protein [Ectocarpus siliculosus]
MANSTSPTVPNACSDPQKVSFSSLDAPVKRATVYKNRAEITRVVSFSPTDRVGLHKVELTGLPWNGSIEEQSLTVKGSGHCTILDASFSEDDSTVEDKPLSSATPSEKKENEQEQAKAVAALRTKMQALKEDHAVLETQLYRTEQLRQLADRVVDKATLAFEPSVGGRVSGARGGGDGDPAAAAAANAAQGSMDIASVSSALDWWESKRADIDERCHRITVHGKRVVDAMSKLDNEHAALTKHYIAAKAGGGRASAKGNFSFSKPKPFSKLKPQAKAKVVVTVDVEELLCPIELEVSYMSERASWLPSYSLRVDALTGCMSCTYFGRVSQSTNEDWEGVALKLSTAEPSARSTPPFLTTKTVSLKSTAAAPTQSPPPPPSHASAHLFGVTSVPGAGKTFEAAAPQAGGFMFDATPAPATAAPAAAPQAGGFFFGAAASAPTAAAGAAAAPTCFGGAAGAAATPAVGGFGFGFGAPGPIAAATEEGTGEEFVSSAPPPPPEAKPAVAQVEGGGVGAVTFAIEKPATVKGNGESTKLSVAVLQLSTDVVHYVVPSRDATAFLQANATNNTDYLLLASEDVSIFFDNSFVAKTSLTSVSPGESFQTFLGIDPAVKVKVAPPRKTSKQKGLFGKVDHVAHIHSTVISNKKKVPVTCVVIEALPLSTNEIIKVKLQQPAPAKVTESVEAVNDEALVDAGLAMFGGQGKDYEDDGGTTKGSTAAAPEVVKTGIAGITKGPTNHLAWVLKVAPQDDISIPLEYTVEWPIGKEVVFKE